LAARKPTATACASKPEGFNFFASENHGATDLTIRIGASCFAHGALAPQTPSLVKTRQKSGSSGDSIGSQIQLSSSIS
jgi:hypothetical protein